MKKKLLVILALTICSVVGCGSVSKSEAESKTQTTPGQILEVTTTTSPETTTQTSNAHDRFFENGQIVLGFFYIFRNPRESSAIGVSVYFILTTC